VSAATISFASASARTHAAMSTFSLAIEIVAVARRQREHQELSTVHGGSVRP
jgi:hypothetical protein